MTRTVYWYRVTDVGWGRGRAPYEKKGETIGTETSNRETKKKVDTGNKVGSVSVGKDRFCEITNSGKGLGLDGEVQDGRPG